METQGVIETFLRYIDKNSLNLQHLRVMDIQNVMLQYVKFY